VQNPPRSKREHLCRLVAGKREWSDPVSPDDQAKGFRGWHERGYLPHYDKPGLTQFVTFRLWDSLPASRGGEWEHLLTINERSDAPRSGTRSIASPEETAATEKGRNATRELRQKLEEYLDRSRGECFLRDSRVATLMEDAMRFHHSQRFELLAWVVMPNHVHTLLKVGDTPLSKIIQNWKSVVAVAANRLLGRTGDFWQADYWDTYMRDAEQTRKAVRYIENNPVKAKLCRAPEEWPFSSARFCDPRTRELKLPK
jgi:REP element-mobilizing transposase RayT